MRKSAWLFALMLTSAAMGPQASAKPVEYVKICSLYGAEFFYLPGTDMCLNPDTGDIRFQTELGTVRKASTLASRIGALEGDVQQLEALKERFDTDFRDANDGSAIAMAVESPDLEGSERYGIKLNWGTYQGSNAFGASFAGVIAEHAGDRLTVSGGVAVTGSNVGGHAGVQLSW